MQSRAQMNNRDKAPKARTLEEMIGFETFTDSRPEGLRRDWKIRVFTVAEWTKYQRTMDRLVAAYASQRAQGEFLQSVLLPVEPTRFQRLKSVLGFAPLSMRDVARSIPIRDFQKIIDAACIANVGKTLAELAEENKESAQKKTAVT